MFGYSRQVYYRSIQRRKSKQKRAEQVLSLVKEVRMQMPRLGTRKLYTILKHDLKLLGVGRDQLFSILRANKMLIKRTRSYHITTDSHHRFRKHKNLIQELEVTRPEQVWVSDITYIGKRTNPMYLSLITDAYSKKIMGYDVSNTLAVSGALSALKMAISKRSYPSKELIHHSDRGLQYCSDEYQHQLMKQKITCSMTESYDPYANAVAERINGILKQEFLGDSSNCRIQIMKSIIKQTVEIYNTKRPHLSCYMKTPDKTHRQQKMKIRTYKSKSLSKNILSILEDKSGNVWFGTDGQGVSKYDGTSFTHLTQNEGLSNNFIWSILEDRNGNLWFGTDEGGANYYDGKSFTYFTKKQGLSDNVIFTILEDKHGDIWFGTRDGGVNRYDGEKFTHFTVKEGLGSNTIYSIIEDSKGNLWFATDKGASRYDGESITNFTEKEGLSSNSV
ncbi:MAG: IS3 family transposase [Crocinitomicaceae bacterium]